MKRGEGGGGRGNKGSKAVGAIAIKPRRLQRTVIVVIVGGGSGLALVLLSNLLQVGQVVGAELVDDAGEELLQLCRQERAAAEERKSVNKLLRLSSTRRHTGRQTEHAELGHKHELTLGLGRSADDVGVGGNGGLDCKGGTETGCVRGAGAEAQVQQGF